MQEVLMEIQLPVGITEGQKQTAAACLEAKCEEGEVKGCRATLTPSQLLALTIEMHDYSACIVIDQSGELRRWIVQS